MTRFTEQNTDGFNKSELEILNVAFDEAWGAIKGRSQRDAQIIDDDDAYQVKVSLSDAINNAWMAGINSENLAEKALRSMGMVPVRDVYSLEIQ
jgi:hypothetical protein